MTCRGDARDTRGVVAVGPAQVNVSLGRARGELGDVRLDPDGAVEVLERELGGLHILRVAAEGRLHALHEAGVRQGGGDLVAGNANLSLGDDVGGEVVGRLEGAGGIARAALLHAVAGDLEPIGDVLGIDGRLVVEVDAAGQQVCEEGKKIGSSFQSIGAGIGRNAVGESRGASGGSGRGDAPFAALAISPK